MEGDPPEVFARKGWAWKHIFVADSEDAGKTWSPSRQVATETGQCHGAPVGLTGGRAVLIHDERRDAVSGARALVSDDEGKTWNDEVYYLTHGDAAGYARSVSFDGEEILTMTGSFYGDSFSWSNLIGNSRQYIIRWRLED